MSSPTASRTERLRAAFLAAIMILSVLVVPIAFAGGAAAQSTGGGVTLDFSGFDGSSFDRGETTTNTADLTVNRSSNLDSNNEYTVQIEVTDPDGQEVDVTNPDDVSVNNVTFPGVGSFELVEDGGSYYIGESGAVATRTGSQINSASPINGDLNATVDEEARFGDYSINGTVVEWDSGVNNTLVTESATVTVENTAATSGATSSTNNAVDEAAQINVSVSDPLGIDEDTIDIEVSDSTGATTVLVNNGSVTENATVGANATFTNDLNESVESVNLTSELPENKTGYDITVDAENTAGTPVSATLGTAFTVDMAGDALKVTPDSNNAFANTDGDDADGDEKASISVVAVDQFGNELQVNDGNTGVDRGEITLTTQDSSVSINKDSGGLATSSSLVTFTVSDTEAESVSLTALDTNAANNTLTRGSAQQTFVPDIAGIDVSTTDDDATLPADASTESTITAQLIDSNGEDVNRGGINVQFSIENSTAAGVVTPGGQSATTDSSGAATINITADTAGELITITGIDQGTGNGFSDTTQVETVAGDISTGNSEFSINGGTADVTGVQVASEHDLAVTLEDTTGNAVAGSPVEFTANASGALFGSSSVTTNETGVATTTVTLPEQKGTTQLNVTAGVFNATATSAAQLNVTTVAENTSTLQFASDSPDSIAPNSEDNTIGVEAVDNFGNINESTTGTVTLESGDTSVVDFDGAATSTDSLANGVTSFNVDANGTGTATLTATIPDENVTNVSQDITVANPAAIELTPAHNVATTDAADANSDTRNQAELEARFVDANGDALGINSENITFARQSGDAAELNQSNADFTKMTDANGNATIDVNGTSTTGETTFIALAENFNVQGSATVTTTGAAQAISVTPESDTLTAGETTNLTAEFVDSEGRNVPRVGGDIQISTSNGAIDSSPSSTALSDGQVVAEFTYNATDADAGDATLTAVGGGLSGAATVTIEGEAAPEASVTFNDAEVENGTETVTVDSANYTLASGDAGDYQVAVHVVSDEFDGGVSGVVGVSNNQTGAAEDISVDLNVSALDANDNLTSLTENATLRAMLHETGDPVGSPIQIDGETVTDDANITVADDAGTPPEDPQERALAIAGVDDPAQLTQDDVTAAITRFERGEPVNNIDINQDDVTATITLFERN